jgi:dihydrodipicolinate synthase/N-acetylneuraminate lyase
MSPFNPGFVHCPVTPFKRDNAVDYATYGKVLDFHINNGADALALPMPQAEDLSLTDVEQRELLRFAIEHVNGRVPVIAHISDPGTMIAVDRAKHAAALGAAAIASRPPYFWHPKPAMVVEHLVAIGSATKLPFFVCTPPVEDPGTHMTAEMVLEVAQRLENMVGLVDASMRFVFMAEIASQGSEIRPDFQLLAGTDYIVPNNVVGGRGGFSPLASVAPKLARELYDLCAKQQFTQARKAQEQMATLSHALKKAGFAGLKDAMRAMGRDVGMPRPPVDALGEVEAGVLAERLHAMTFLEREPRGW